MGASCSPATVYPGPFGLALSASRSQPPCLGFRPETPQPAGGTLQKRKNEAGIRSVTGKVAQCISTTVPEAAGTTNAITWWGTAPHSVYIPSTLAPAVLGWEGGGGGWLGKGLYLPHLIFSPEQPPG